MSDRPRSSADELVRRLTPSCVAALEAGITRALIGRNYEVRVEHMLLGLLEERRSDFATLLALHAVDARAVRSALEDRCASLRSGSLLMPALSPALLQLLDDALWNVTDPGGRAKTRSAALLQELLRDPARHEVTLFMARLRKIPNGAKLAVLPLGELAKEEAESRAVGERGPRPEQRRAVRHVVEPGEDVLAIARRYALDVEEVARDNGLAIDATPAPGTSLELRVLERFAPAEANPESDRP